MQDRSSKDTPHALRGEGNRSKKRGQGPPDINQVAFNVVQQATRTGTARAAEREEPRCGDVRATWGIEGREGES
jgi:hypothetical protein